jgi:hypothetical protein
MNLLNEMTYVIEIAESDLASFKIDQRFLLSFFMFISLLAQVPMYYLSNLSMEFLKKLMLAPLLVESYSLVRKCSLLYIFVRTRN